MELAEKKGKEDETPNPIEESVMKAIVREGSGESPEEGDQVIYHYAVKNEDDEILYASRTDNGGFPKRHVLGKNSILFLFEATFYSMKENEICMVKADYSQHYGHPNCQVPVPEWIPTNGTSFFQIELIAIQKIKFIAEEGNVTKKILEKGIGWDNPREPSEVNLILEGFDLKEKNYFSTSGKSVCFQIGKDQLPAELESGICSMLKGEKSIIYFSIEKYDGDYKNLKENKNILVKNHEVESSILKNFPPGAKEFVFHVELTQIIQIRDILGEGSILKKRIKDGNGDFPVDCPLEDTKIKIHYSLYLLENSNQTSKPSEIENQDENPSNEISSDSQELNKGEQSFELHDVFSMKRKEIYNSRKGPEGNREEETEKENPIPLEIETGEGLFPEGIDLSVRLMLPNEISLIYSKSKYAYDTFPREDVPKGSDVLWEIELVDFEKPKDWSPLSFDEIMEEGNQIKEKANAIFRRGVYEKAKSKYEKLFSKMNHIQPHNESEENILNSFRFSLQLNISSCFFKLQNFFKSIEWADKVLAENSSNSKALYRRAMAKIELFEFDEAISDLETMIKCEPSTKSDYEKAVSILKKKRNQAQAKEKKEFGGFFDKSKKGSGASTVQSKEQGGLGAGDRSSTAENLHGEEIPKQFQVINNPTSLWQTFKAYLKIPNTRWPWNQCTIL